MSIPASTLEAQLSVAPQPSGKRKAPELPKAPAPKKAKTALDKFLSAFGLDLPPNVNQEMINQAADIVARAQREGGGHNAAGVAVVLGRFLLLVLGRDGQLQLPSGGRGPKAKELPEPATCPFKAGAELAAIYNQETPTDTACRELKEEAGKHIFEALPGLPDMIRQALDADEEKELGQGAPILHNASYAIGAVKAREAAKKEDPSCDVSGITGKGFRCPIPVVAIKGVKEEDLPELIGSFGDASTGEGGVVLLDLPFLLDQMEAVGTSGDLWERIVVEREHLELLKVPSGSLVALPSTLAKLGGPADDGSYSIKLRSEVFRTSTVKIYNEDACVNVDNPAVLRKFCP